MSYLAIPYIIVSLTICAWLFLSIVLAFASIPAIYLNQSSYCRNDWFSTFITSYVEWSCVIIEFMQVAWRGKSSLVLDFIIVLWFNLIENIKMKRWLNVFNIITFGGLWFRHHCEWCISGMFNCKRIGIIKCLDTWALVTESSMWTDGVYANCSGFVIKLREDVTGSSRGLCAHHEFVHVEQMIKYGWGVFTELSCAYMEPDSYQSMFGFDCAVVNNSIAMYGQGKSVSLLEIEADALSRERWMQPICGLWDGEGFTLGTEHEET